MKTMNVLLLMGLLIFNSSCTNYNPIGGNGSNKESETYYLELDFHQLALINEDHQLRFELLEIEEQLENGNEKNQWRIEEIQMRRAVIEETLVSNTGILARWPGGIPGGGLPPSCVPDRPTYRPCPMPFIALNNLVVFAKDDFEIQVQDIKGNVVGEMVDLQPMPGTDGLFVKAIMEYDLKQASKAVVTKLDSRGMPTATEYDLVN